jgi:hypothetical protein
MTDFMTCDVKEPKLRSKRYGAENHRLTVHELFGL